MGCGEGDRWGHHPSSYPPPYHPPYPTSHLLGGGEGARQTIFLKLHAATDEVLLLLLLLLQLALLLFLLLR